MSKKASVLIIIILVIVLISIISFGIINSKYESADSQKCKVSVSNNSKEPLKVLVLDPKNFPIEKQNEFTEESGIELEVSNNFLPNTALETINKNDSPRFDLAVDLNSEFISYFEPCKTTNEFSNWNESKYVVAYNSNYFAKHSLTPPANIKELANLEYKNLIAIPEINTIAGRAIQLNIASELGDQSWQNLYRSLKNNNVDFETDLDELTYSKFGNPDLDQNKFPIAFIPETALNNLTDAKSTSITARELTKAVIFNKTNNFKNAEHLIDFLKSERSFDSDYSDGYIQDSLEWYQDYRKDGWFYFSE